MAAAGVALINIEPASIVLKPAALTKPAQITETAEPATIVSQPLPQPLPVSTPPAPAIAPAIIPAIPITPTAPITRPINLQTAVVLRCDFVNNQGRKKQAFGSGVIISPQGVILTARHVFDLDYAYQITGGNQGAAGYDFQGCDVGQPPAGTTTPTISQIRAINPFTIVDILPYRAEKFFVASGAGWSEAEFNFIDIGLLKISGVNSDGPAFGYTSLPASFQFSPMVTDEVPADGEEIVTFGFPSGNPQYGGRFFLQGSVGQTTAVIVGDKQFAGGAIGIQAQMETIGGRSGSPVFWRGSVMGIVSSKEDFSLSSTSISVAPLLRVLREAGVSF